MAPIQFFVRGKPSAFDLSFSNDVIAVSSPGCISLFGLNAFGSPKQVIHYEQPQQIRHLKYQRGNQSLLAALRGPSLSFWDSNVSSKPLCGLLHNLGWITDIDWCHSESTLLATSNDLGDLQIFDIRTMTVPIMSTSLGSSTSQVLWCPTNPNLLSCVNKNSNVIVWDCRMLGGGKKALQLFNFDQDIIQTDWSRDSSSFLVGLSSGSIEWWNLDDLGRRGSDIKVTRDSILRPPIIDSNSIIMSSPRGRGAVVTRLNSSEYIDISLYGRARGGSKLVNVHNDPTFDIYSDGPHTILAHANETIVGMRWGTPGRLFPPAHGGLELLVFTESARLHPVIVPADVVFNYCGGKSIQMSKDPSRPQKSTRKTQLAPKFGNVFQYVPKYSIDDLKIDISNTRNSTITSDIDLDELSDFNSTRHVQLSTTPPLDMDLLFQNTRHETTSDIFWRQAKDHVLYLQNIINNVWMSHLCIGAIDEKNRTILLGMKKTTSSGPNRTTYVPTSPQDFALLISFPSAFNSNSLPTYELQPMPKDSQMFSSLIHELNGIARNAWENINKFDQIENKLRLDIRKYSGESPELDYYTAEKNFLVGAAQSFRNHVMQDWEMQYINPIDSNSSTILLATDATSKPDPNFIAEKAYKIPCPPVSGARFSSRGILIVFGEGMPFTPVTVSTRFPTDQSSQKKLRLLKDDRNSIADTQDNRSVVNSLSHRSNGERPNNSTAAELQAGGVLLSNRKVEETYYCKSYGDYLIRKRLDQEKIDEMREYDLKMNLPDANATSTPQTIGDSEQKSTSSGSSIRSLGSLDNLSLSDDDGTIQTSEIFKPPIPVNMSRGASLSSSNRLISHISSMKGFSNGPPKPLSHPIVLVPVDNTSYNYSHVRSYEVTEFLEQDLGLHYDLGPKERDPFVYEGDGIHDSRVVEACYHNTAIAMKYNAPYVIVQFWELLAISLKVLSIPESSGGLISWSESSLGHTLFYRLIASLMISGDIVNLGTVICVLGGSNAVRTLFEPPDTNESQQFVRNVSLPSPFTTFDSVEQYFENVLLAYADLLYRYHAWPKATEVRNYFSLETMKRIEGRNKEAAAKDDAVYLFKTKQFTFDIDWYCRRCGLLATFKKKADIHSTDGIKHQSSSLSQRNSSPSIRRIASGNLLYFNEYDDDENDRLWCKACAQYAVNCGLCQMPIRGVSYTCLICGHGGHPEHMKMWFSEFNECPTGCGCFCANIATNEKKSEEEGIPMSIDVVVNRSDHYQGIWDEDENESSSVDNQDSHYSETDSDEASSSFSNDFE